MNELSTNYTCPGCGEEFVSPDFGGDGLRKLITCEDCGCTFHLAIEVKYVVETTKV